MNLVDELNRKIESIDPHERVGGVRAAIRHIEIAERHLRQGREQDDFDLFNDVIYRTNQAFEGMLKEAYSVITEKDASRTSPNEIERYLVDRKKLAPRVLKLFTNYRQDWRNPATHDHTLLFSEDEALLAIVSVSAFSVVLLNQIVETVNFKRERREAEQRRKSGKGAIEGEGSLGDLVVAYLARYSFEGHDRTITESEIIGRISGYLVGSDPEMKIQPDAAIAGNLQADLVVGRREETVIIEVKVGRPSERLVRAAVAQLTTLLNASQASAGVVLVLAREPFEALQVTDEHLDSGKVIHIMSPL